LVERVFVKFKHLYRNLRIPSKLDHGKNLFKGLVIHVNGWTGNITHSELRDLICGHGGKFEQYDTGQNSITHIITRYKCKKSLSHFFYFIFFFGILE